MAVASELLAIVQGLMDLGVDLKKGKKAGNMLSAVLSDADLIAKLEVVLSNLGNLPADVKAVQLSDAPALLGAVISGVENIIAA